MCHYIQNTCSFCVTRKYITKISVLPLRETFFRRSLCEKIHSVHFLSICKMQHSSFFRTKLVIEPKLEFRKTNARNFAAMIDIKPRDSIIVSMYDNLDLECSHRNITDRSARFLTTRAHTSLTIDNCKLSHFNSPYNHWAYTLDIIDYRLLL